MPPDVQGEGPPLPRPAPRPPAEIERELDLERQGLVDAITSLKGEAAAARAKVMSKRTAGIVGGVVGALLFFRLLRRRRRSRG